MEKQPACDHFELLPRRKLCVHCYNPKEDHAFDDEDISDLKEILQNIANVQEISYPLSDSVYSWLPPKCPANRYEDYFKEIPVDMVPKLRSEGALNRLKGLFKQIPITDLSESHCRFVEPECQADLKSFIQNLKSKYLKFGSVMEWESGLTVQCPKCLTLFEKGELIVKPTHTNPQAFHIACFLCNKCCEYTVDLIHCSDTKGTVYCVRHFSETLKKRCHACDELIFALRFSQAREKFYHRDHLFCFSPDCDLPLENNKGFEKDDELYCSKCYEKYFADDCAKCGNRIAVGSQHITHDGKCWHLNCFTCEKCKEVLSDFSEHEGKFYCTNCYNEDIAPHCKGCGELFEGHVKVAKFGDDIYHVGCFKCFDCKKVIGTDSFIPHNDKIYCKECYTRNFGIKCNRCKYAITEDQGVMHNKKPYHINCFTCHNCSTLLADIPFKTVDDEWFCLSCYAMKKNKICQACGELIDLGENNLLYVFEDYKWHPDCFVCKSCQRSLAGSMFAMRGSDIFCQNCCSQESTASATAKPADSTV